MHISDLSSLEGEREPTAIGPLSRREAEVLGLVSLGLTNRQVADRLEVTVYAIKFHLGSIFRKLGVGNRTEAAVLFMRASDGTEPDSTVRL